MTKITSTLIAATAVVMAFAVPAKADVKDLLIGGLVAIATDQCSRNDRCAGLVDTRSTNVRHSERRGQISIGRTQIRGLVERYGRRATETCLESRSCSAAVEEVLNYGDIRDMDDIFDRVSRR